LRRSLDDLGSETNATTVRLNGEIARAHMFRDEPDLALAAISRALEGAEAMNLRVPAIHLLITKSWVLGALRRGRESTALLLGAMRMADDEGDPGARIRARFNLSGYMATDDPHLGLQVALEGIALAEQYGLALNAANMAGNAATMAVQIGDLELVDRLEQGVADLKTPIALGIRGYAAIAAALRGRIEGAAQRMSMVHDAHAASSSLQDVASVSYQDAAVAFAEGRLGEARTFARKSRDAYFGADGPLAAVVAGHASILLAEADELEQDRPWLHANAAFGAWVDRSRRTVDAAALALEGRDDEARVAYRRVIDEWRAANLRLDLALALLERARLLGDVDPESQAGREEAAQIVEAMGAAGLLERLESAAGARPSRSTEPRATPVRASRVAS